MTIGLCLGLIFACFACFFINCGQFVCIMVSFCVFRVLWVFSFGWVWLSLLVQSSTSAIGKIRPQNDLLSVEWDAKMPMHSLTFVNCTSLQ